MLKHNALQLPLFSLFYYFVRAYNSKCFAIAFLLFLPLRITQKALQLLVLFFFYFYFWSLILDRLANFFVYFSYFTVLDVCSQYLTY